MAKTEKAAPARTPKDDSAISELKSAVAVLENRVDILDQRIGEIQRHGVAMPYETAHSILRTLLSAAQKAERDADRPKKARDGARAVGKSLDLALRHLDAARTRQDAVDMEK